MDFNKIVKEVKEKYLNKNFLIKNRTVIIKYGVLLLILISGIIYLIVDNIQNDEFKQTSIIDEENQEIEDNEDNIIDDGAFGDGNSLSGKIIVDIGGEVSSPQVVVLDENSRVEDAIIAAGGLTDDADISMINRASILSDGEKIYIPSLSDGEVGYSSSGESSYTGNASGTEYSSLVNINTADVTLLQEITGVGPATAQKIIDYRNSNGNFKDIEDIMNVSGIGEKTFENMKNEITV